MIGWFKRLWARLGRRKHKGVWNPAWSPPEHINCRCAPWPPMRDPAIDARRLSKEFAEHAAANPPPRARPLGKGEP